MTDERTLRILELTAVRSLLAERTGFPPSRELAESVAPVADLAAAERLQDETQAMRELVRASPSTGLRGARDVREAVQRARLGGRLDPEQLWAVGATVRAGEALFAQVRPHPPLAARARLARPPLGVAQAVEHAISPEGEVLDRASAALASARTELRAAQARLQQRVDALLRTPSLAKVLQEPIVTQRSGRYVVPVRADSAAAVKGIVHDRSASGQTVFIEPLEILEANNHVREAEIAERTEVERVLEGLSRQLERDADDALATVDALAQLDLILARAALAEAHDAVRPRLGADGIVDLIQARHPLLIEQIGDAVVPIDVRLGGEARALVVTGPNTGGKTVTLRTIGLLVLMGSCGLQIPAQAGSVLPVVRRVFADIGDEQSIQQSLSTFSSHLRNVVATLSEAQAGDLALLDEIGAGTDPDEGAALAMAVLETLLERGVLVAATTHYPELKAFALNTSGARNASVEFDPVTLRPTYRVHIGLPGASNAFAIASRLGLSADVLQRAEAHLGELHRSLEKTLREAERARTGLAEELESAQVAHRDARRVLEDARHDADRVREDARAELRRARSEADDLLQQARRAMRQVEDARDRTSRRDLVEDARAALAEAEAARDAAAPAPARAPSASAPEVGSAVLVDGVSEPGTLLGVDERGIADVAAGPLRLRVPLASLRSAPEGARPAAEPVRRTSTESSTPLPLQLDLRGARVEEALAKHPLVRGIANPGPSEGGDGATIVTL